MKTLTKVFALFALLFTACSEPEVVEPQNPDVEQGDSLSEVNVKIDNSYTRVAAVAGNVLQTSSFCRRIAFGK